MKFLVDAAALIQKYILVCSTCYAAMQACSSLLKLLIKRLNPANGTRKEIVLKPWMLPTQTLTVGIVPGITFGSISRKMMKPGEMVLREKNLEPLQLKKKC